MLVGRIKPLDDLATSQRLGRSGPEPVALAGGGGPRTEALSLLRKFAQETARQVEQRSVSCS